ncbi:MAG: cytoplasmic protein [Deltaproteobacteria bacterium]|nr:cytoplasmic protein [Deltaproteobacteria bacterium]
MVNRNRPQYREFRASELFCPRCRTAMPVRERLLLVLPDGDLFEYCCQGCGSSLGKRKVEADGASKLVLAR